MCALKMKCPVCRNTFLSGSFRHVVVEYTNQEGEDVRMASAAVHEGCAETIAAEFRAHGHRVEVEEED